MALVEFLVEILQNPLFSITAILTACVIGIIQGIVLGKAILLRFPRLQTHVKTVSASLFFLFLANAILSVPRFASPDKIDLTPISQVGNPQELTSLIFTIIGMNAGFFAVIATSVTVMTFLLLKFTRIHGFAKIFVFFFSVLILLLTGLSRFTDLTPSRFEVFLYFLYQLGITIGIMAGSARKIKIRKLDWD